MCVELHSLFACLIFCVLVSLCVCFLFDCLFGCGCLFAWLVWVPVRRRVVFFDGELAFLGCNFTVPL